MGKPRRDAGFTLIEIAIVLVVLGLLLASFIGPLSTRLEQEERERTVAMLEDIKEALYGFATVHGRLPCPDSEPNPINRDGRENKDTPPPGGCTGGVVVGNVPWADLGIPELDAWGNRFLYRVTANYADDPDPITPTLGTGCLAGTLPPSQASFALCSQGDITIQDRAQTPAGGGPPLCTSPANIVASMVPAVVLSLGKHRFSNPPDPATPPSCFERENFEGSNPVMPGNSVFFIASRRYSQAPGLEFDDMVVWLSPFVLKNRMIMAGKLP